MPFKSQAQRRKFAELLVKSDITPEQYERWNRETGGTKLPERAKPTRKRKSRRKPKLRSKTRKSAGRSKRRGAVNHRGAAELLDGKISLSLLSRCNDDLWIVIPHVGRTRLKAVNGHCGRCGYRLAWIVIRGELHGIGTIGSFAEVSDRHWQLAV
jgi:hypothetical protein